MLRRASERTAAAIAASAVPAAPGPAYACFSAADVAQFAGKLLRRLLRGSAFRSKDDR